MALATHNIFDVPGLSDDHVREIFANARWPDGIPSCPKCGARCLYNVKRNQMWRCKSCATTFSVTGGTSFGGQKLGLKKLLLQVMLFARCPKGKSSLALCRDLGIQQKTAFVTMHKLRHLIRQEQNALVLDGIVEIDGGVFGGHRINSNNVSISRGSRHVFNCGRNRRVVVVMRQRGGRTVTTVVRKESEAIGRIIQQVSPTAIIQTDQARAWDSLMELFSMMRVNHKYSFSANMACTNNAERFFASLRRMHIGTHHQFSAQYMHLYSAELAWREDFSKRTDWERAQMLLRMALTPCTNNLFKGYWQNHAVPVEQTKVANLIRLSERIGRNLAEAA